MSQSRARPERVSPPAFFINSDFYGQQSESHTPFGHDSTSASEDGHHFYASASSSGHAGGGGPPSSSADYYRTSTGPIFSPPILSPSPISTAGSYPATPLTPGTTSLLRDSTYSAPTAPFQGTSNDVRNRLSFPRAFPPSAFSDPDQIHAAVPRRSVSEDYNHTRPNSALAGSHRSSSLNAFAPPPAPWMRNSSYASDSGSRISTPVGRGTLTPRKREFTSNLLTGPVEKPWLDKKDKWARVSWWITFCIFLVGVGASAVYCFFMYRAIPSLGRVCLVLDETFDTLDTNIWQREVELGGFGNGQFEWTTASDTNSFVENGRLYIVPTLTEDAIGHDAVFNGGKITLPDCTTTNKTACSATSNAAAGRVINPVQSARLNTKQSKSIRFGRVEVRAKLPKGDWMWPAIWMLPVQETYGAWPLSGEIDIMEARGNAPSYPGQGRNYVSSALNWGPTKQLNMWYKTWGWRWERRTSYDQDFHTYALEWSQDFLWAYVDTRLTKVLDLRFNQNFFQRGGFPPTIQNGSSEIVTPNPWKDASNAAPFDQPFYLILNVAVGSTNGWFADNVGGKPWLDNSATAMRDFAMAKDTWYATWPSEPRDRAMVVDYVKMYEKC